ncbi:cytochrome [Hydrogenophaga crassostreae]|uniref:Cytochrome n=1 Tax=Hydrogenophaga crassostreae TaxID=1763535 RepID=A0A167IT57_9BURK|nr:cytochrome P450 [Hydrogenophaga crassostreae]AOW14424.1 cytochrome [Hydrogenophaga crassostreae]OAD43551.1 cytochrome [Hydrogenophaga crassostreae]
MTANHQPDWNPRDPDVLDDQLAAYDAMRLRCPVAHSEYLWWSLFRHADVMRVLKDHETFSNAASNHLSIPNAMDPPEHTGYRRIIEAYFTPEHMDAFEPVCQAIGDTLVAQLPRGEAFDLMTECARPFALRIQCAFMGWPDSLHEPLGQWVAKNHRATRAGDRSAMAQIALEFDGHIKQQLVLRRDAGEQAPGDVTTRLLHERINGRPLSDEEIVSIVRNWTVGELGTIAASVGILVHHLASHPALQKQLRLQPGDLPAAIDEILRIHPPLIANRRITTCPVDIGGQHLEAGERVTLIWGSANRDEAVFGDPDAFDPEHNAANNLLYGAGVHVCPGAPLARLELHLLMRALLANTREMALNAGQAPLRASFPASGFTALPVRLL